MKGLENWCKFYKTITDNNVFYLKTEMHFGFFFRFSYLFFELCLYQI